MASFAEQHAAIPVWSDFHQQVMVAGFCPVAHTEFHWQITLSDGTPVVDYWPSNKRLRALAGGGTYTGPIADAVAEASRRHKQFTTVEAARARELVQSNGHAKIAPAAPPRDDVLGVLGQVYDALGSLTSNTSRSQVLRAVAELYDIPGGNHAPRDA